MRRIVVLGVDVLGRLLAESIELAGADDLVGFVDDRPGKQVVLGGSSDLPVLKADGVTHVAVGIGDNATRRRVSESVESLGLELATVVHPQAFVSPAARLAAGAFVDAFASVHSGARIGRGVVLMPHVWVGHDVVLGDWAWASGHAAIGGFASVGDAAKIGVGAIVGAHATVPAGETIGPGALYSSDA